MTKVYVKVGFGITEEIRPGVWMPVEHDCYYYGEMTNYRSRNQTASKVNDDLHITNQLSFVADPFAIENFHTIRYVELGGTPWKVTDISLEFPRIILQVGGVYNEAET